MEARKRKTAEIVSKEESDRDYGIQMKPNYDMPQGFDLKEPPSNATKTVYSILQQLVNLIPPLEFPKVRMKLNESVPAVPAKTKRRFSCNAGCLVFVLGPMGRMGPIGPISCDRSYGIDGIDFDNGAKSVGTEPFGTSSMGQLRLDVQSVSSVLRLASA